MLAHRNESPSYALALVALPWAVKDHPSAALAALGAYVRRELPGVNVTLYSEFVNVAGALGDDLYDALADRCHREGELVYMALAYPGRRPAVVATLAHWAEEHLDRGMRGEAANWSTAIESLLCLLEQRIVALAQELKLCNALGLTTTFGQTFSSIALAREVKRLNPGIKVIFGGSAVSGQSGPSLLAEYPEIDYIVQGEGEQPIVHLLDCLTNGRPVIAGTPGVLYREANAPSSSPVPFSEIKVMDDLPLPDYSEYAALAEVYDFDWTVPMEGSRGCWWDRTSRRGNPKDTCYYCSVNVQWGGYREKSVDRAVSEVLELSERYRKLKFFFVDNIIRNHELDRFARSLRDSGKQFEIFYEMRANIRSHDFLLLWEAGLASVQIGIEALSTSVLSRIGKGTTTIQNLYAMRLCAEFGVTNISNLIISFPGSTTAEVEGTVDVIENYALAYGPLNISRFSLLLGTTVDVLREEFGIVNARSPDLFKAGLPEDVWQRLQFQAMDFETMLPVADWTPVVELCKRWHSLHQNVRAPLLRYQDGGSFLTIEDRRFGDFRTGTFEGIERDIYLFCTEIRSEKQILERFPEIASRLKELLAAWIEFRIIFHEAGKYLSLAVASAPHQAARRIRALHQDERARRTLPSAPATVV
jgi:ribosomal peptide maturation radical SAM protein 1